MFSCSQCMKIQDSFDSPNLYSVRENHQRILFIDFYDILFRDIKLSFAEKEVLLIKKGFIVYSLL